MKLINELLLFILMISKKHNIDESHDISHSMDVWTYYIYILQTTYSLRAPNIHISSTEGLHTPIYSLFIMIMMIVLHSID